MKLNFLKREFIGVGIIVGMTACLAILPGRTNAAYEPVPNTKRPVCSNKPIRSVGTTAKVVAFTFDDGPWPTNTQAIMSSFERYGARASFFMIGRNARYYSSIAKDVVRRGHEVGNHSETHAYYNDYRIASEIGTAQWSIRQAAGVIPWTFRAPGLTRGPQIDAKVGYYKLCNVSTDYDIGDWRSPRIDAWTLCERFKRSLHPGSIVLIHDGGSHSQTVKAVPCMLAYAKAQGYRFLTISQLLNAGTHRY